jgi:hypothetical protein
MIYKAEDKNNSRLDRRRMGQFHRFLNEALLKEINLQGLLFTWSNEHDHPTHERIDRAFISNEWEGMFLNNDMHPLGSMCSDHAPLLLQLDIAFYQRKRFQFKAFWPKCSGFAEVVQRAWYCPLRDANPFRRLYWLLRNTARMLTSWADRFISNVKTQLEMAKEVVAKLEAARDHCQLAAHEESLRCEMKLKTLGLSSLHRSIARQESRVLWLSEGDAPTRFFHAQASVRRRRRQFIRSLEHEGHTLVSEESKATTVFEFFYSIMGTAPNWSCSISF